MRGSGALIEAFKDQDVTIIDVDYSKGQLTDKSPYAYIDAIGKSIAECKDTEIVIVAHSIAPLMVLTAIEKYDQSGKIVGLISLGACGEGFRFQPTGYSIERRKTLIPIRSSFKQPGPTVSLLGGWQTLTRTTQ